MDMRAHFSQSPSLPGLPGLETANDEWYAALDRPVPQTIAVGRGTTLAVTGWCFHRRRQVVRVALRLLGRSFPVDLFGIQRRELLEQFGPKHDPRGHAQWSGFAGLVSIPAIEQPREATLAVEAGLDNGITKTTPVARLSLHPTINVAPPELRSSHGSMPNAPIAVCMTTYNPPPELFARQVESLRQQTERDWICIICDDASRPDRFAHILATAGFDRRFLIYRQPANRGFYHNFEQCLALVPPTAEFIALSDQDDCWHPEKLATLRQAFDTSTSLVYSDMRIVHDDGTVVSPTYWTTRCPNASNFASMLIANTVTGAASMFRRRLLDVILPFPQSFGAAFHDHWIACAALATGSIRYVDQPLYDYVQHGGNVIGHFAPAALPLWTRAWRWLKFWWPPKLARNIKVALGAGRKHYFDNLLRVQQLAHTLALRCSSSMAPAKRLALRRIATMHATATGALWLLARTSRHPSGVSDTVGMEFYLLNAIWWRPYARLKAWLLAGRSRRVDTTSHDAKRRAA